MGKIIDKVRQREFDAALNRRYMQRNTLAGRNATPLVADQINPFGDVIALNSVALPWQIGSAYMPPLPKSSNSG